MIRFLTVAAAVVIAAVAILGVILLSPALALAAWLEDHRHAHPRPPGA